MELTLVVLVVWVVVITVRVDSLAKRLERIEKERRG